MVELLKNPRNIEDTILPVVDTVKSWSTDIITFHQIVEDVFEFVSVMWQLPSMVITW